MIDAQKVGYEAAKKGKKTPLFILVGAVIVDIIQLEKVYSLLIRNVMDMFMQRVARCQSLTWPMTANIKCNNNKIEEEHHHAQKIQQQFLETTYQLWLTT